MNSFIAFLVLLLLPIVSMGQNYVTIGGKISNVQEGNCILVTRPGYLGVSGPYSDTIQVDKDGYFADTLKNVDRGVFGSWSLISSTDFRNKGINMFLFPGYNLYITADAAGKGILNTVKYYSCGAVANNYLAQRDQKFVFTPADFYTVRLMDERKQRKIILNKKIDIYDHRYTQAVMMQELDYIDSLKAYYKYQKNFLSNYFSTNTDESDFTTKFFPVLQYIDMNYSVAEALLRYPSQNVIYSHSEKLRPSDINVDFYNNLASDQFEYKDEYMPSSNYRLFVTDFINLITGELESSFSIEPKVVTYTDRFNAALNLYSGLTRDYVLGTIISSKLKALKSGEDEDAGEAKILLKRFTELKPDEGILLKVNELNKEVNIN